MSSRSKLAMKTTALPCTVPPFPLHHHDQERSFDEGLSSVVKMLKHKKRIVVIVGAGMSVSCGIPDFRSRNTGLYATLNVQDLGLSCPEDLFDIHFFKEDARPFYEFSRRLYFPLGNNERVRASDSHKLLALLEQQNKLLRVYTQNIDGLEQKAGVSANKVVYAHGSLQTATCLTCGSKVSAEDLEDDILHGRVARCQKPLKEGKRQPKIFVPLRDSSPRTNKRKRVECTGQCGGVLKPDVTFFGEALHDNVGRCLESDYKKADALIVIGTSLSV